MAVLRDHPEMLLRPEDFSAIRMNWDDKAANLEAIAAELNVGIESIAFLDDNPAERDWVRSQLPDVHVIEAGDDPFSVATRSADRRCSNGSSCRTRIGLVASSIASSASAPPPPPLAPRSTSSCARSR